MSQLIDTVEQHAHTLRDNSEHWKPRMKAMEALLEIATDQTDTPNNLTKEIFSSLKHPIKQQLTDLRSQVVRLACQVVTKFAVVAGHRTRDFLSFVMPQLISMAAGANKVMAGFALDCAREVCSVVQVHKAIAPLCDLCATSRNKAVVECAIECILVALNKWESFRRSDVDSIEGAIEHTLKAASSKARSTSRLCYWAFHKSYPERAVRVMKRTDTRTQNLIIESEPTEIEGGEEEEEEEEEDISSGSTRSSRQKSRNRKKSTTAKGNSTSKTMSNERGENDSGNGENGRRQAVEHMSATMIQAVMRGKKTRSGDTPLKKSEEKEDVNNNEEESISPSRLPSKKTTSPKRSPSSRATASSPRSPSIHSPRSSLEDTYIVGEHVLVTEHLLPAVVKFVGTTKFSHGLWIGCELKNDEDEGKNSGCVRGVRYFKCRDNKGLFVRVGNLKKDDSPDDDGMMKREGEEEEEEEEIIETTVVEEEEQVHDAPEAKSSTTAPPAPPVPPAPSLTAVSLERKKNVGNSSSNVAEQLLNTHRTHVDEVLECLRNEMVILAEFEGAKITSTHRVAAYASQIAESMHKREQMLENMYQKLGTLCATLAKE
jgi:hypothetical protein